MPDGVLALCKAPGPSSQQAVTAVRGLAGGARAGHAGTLDPDAAGVLAVCIGRATRIAEYLRPHPKSYRALVAFGVGTDTDDAGGRVLATATPGALARIDESALRDALAGFVGEQQQLPPAYAAIKHRGRPLYAEARAGRDVPRQPRPVRVDRLRLAGWERGPGLVAAWLEVDCGPGFYVRALARDLGGALGCPAHLAALVRTRSDGFDLAATHTLQELSDPAGPGLWAALVPIGQALAFLPAITLGAEDAALVGHGRCPRGLPRPRCRLLGPGGTLIAVAYDGRLEKVFA